MSIPTKKTASKANKTTSNINNSNYKNDIETMEHSSDAIDSIILSTVYNILIYLYECYDKIVNSVQIDAEETYYSSFKKVVVKNVIGMTDATIRIYNNKEDKLGVFAPQPNCTLKKNIEEIRKVAKSILKGGLVFEKYGCTDPVEIEKHSLLKAIDYLYSYTDLVRIINKGEDESNGHFFSFWR